VKITTQKPIVLESLPVDWNQPVDIISTSKNPRFPLSIQNNDEYLLIINNLEYTPQHSQTVRLSAALNPHKQAPAGCYFQNTSAVRQTNLTNNRFAFSSVSNVQKQQMPVADEVKLTDLQLEPAARKRSFFIFVTDGDLSDKNKYTRVTGQLIQQSPRVAIYLDAQQQTKELTVGLVDAIIEIMEQQVLDQITRKCGPIRDVDQSGRFTILLSPWLSKLQGGKTSINGFVRPSDFRTSVPEPFSNHCDMLYLNSTLKPGQELLDLLSHEVTHAAISSIRTAQHDYQSGPLRDEEDWLNEGIAHIMEPGYTNRDYRISEFYRSPESYPLVVSDYYRAQLWRNHGCRGAVNLFLDWCNQIDPAQNFSYRFAQHPLTGIKKIEQLTEHRFAELFRQWSLHLASQSLNFKSPQNSTSPEASFHCGKFILAGPALRTWNPFHDHSTTLKIASTATCFLHLKSNSQQTRNIMIQINGFRKMQLTLLKIPKNQNQLSLTATNFTPGFKKSLSAEVVEIRLMCQHPINSTVDTISLELSGAGLSRAERKPRKFLTSELNSTFAKQAGSLELRALSSQQNKNSLLTEYLVRLPRSALPRQINSTSLSFKAVVKTRQQTWSATQCELKLPLKTVPRLAESSAKTNVK
ncbi:MAG: hypothetical protein QM501_02000, partial [Gimesia sp.]